MYHNDLVNNEDGVGTWVVLGPAPVIGGRGGRDERGLAVPQFKPKNDETIHSDGIDSVSQIFWGPFVWTDGVDGSIRSFNRDGTVGRVSDLTIYGEQSLLGQFDRG